MTSFFQARFSLEDEKLYQWIAYDLSYKIVDGTLPKKFNLIKLHDPLCRLKLVKNYAKCMEIEKALISGF